MIIRRRRTLAALSLFNVQYFMEQIMSDNRFTERFLAVKQEMAKAVVGCDAAIEDLLVCFFASGNLLIESMPGLGKTLLAKVLSDVLDVEFSRIQFTPDLMPSDIIGTNIIVQDETGHKHIQFQKGPVFTHILLADEINRATPKAQSALLEVMQEHSVTVAGIAPRRGRSRSSSSPRRACWIRKAPTPLPEAQLDRFFFKIVLPNPSRGNLREISRRTTGLETSGPARSWACRKSSRCSAWPGASRSAPRSATSPPNLCWPLTPRPPARPRRLSSSSATALRRAPRRPWLWAQDSRTA